MLFGNDLYAVVITLSYYVGRFGASGIGWWMIYWVWFNCGVLLLDFGDFDLSGFVDCFVCFCALCLTLGWDGWNAGFCLVIS